ncbi:MAG: alpha/beta fold hydrolase [Beijerinckiaceae bacterium]|nr:alpha/beta fold hydrolase [Beijerinckiaceae bacterium]
MAVLGGCASDTFEGQLSPISSPVVTQKSISVFVASTRIRSDKPYTFTYGRSDVVNYQRVDLSMPPGHRSGAIEYPRATPANPETDIAARRNEALSQHDFEEGIAAAAKRGGGEVTLFVHGFNTNYEEAVFRLAQIGSDAGAQGAVVLFAWPSRGRVLDYLADRESATYSRDRLEAVLHEIARQPAVRRINVLAHSMGAFLTMETLRQAKFKGDGEFSGKLNAVVLAAPDIDLDVFRSQLDAIGRRPRPTVLLISGDDQALAFSRLLSGDVDRVGLVDTSSPEARAEIEKRGLVVIDLTNVKADDATNHAKFADVPTTVRFIGMLIGDRRASLQGGVVRLDNAALAAERIGDSIGR